ncbi:hypothetical protein AB0G04_29530 [Actinoplanes sp. NPDC023801]|uniref:hypothetical protein n=1 Tax=Actinoplanes sp. NPDC023801 TaxID=3154595 RepID=UPI0033F64060
MTYRLLLVAYLGLAGLLLAEDRPWLALPLCLAATFATGALWTRAIPVSFTGTGIPAVRGGLAAVAGLVTWPLLALVLHAAGQPVRPVPLIAGCAILITVLGGAAVLRARRRTMRRADARVGLPVQRRHAPAPSPADRPSSADIPASPGDPLPAGGGSPAGGALVAGGALPAGGPLAAGNPSPVGGPPFSGDLPVSSSGGGFADGGVTSRTPRRYARTTAAVTIPVVLAVGVGGVTVRGYLGASRPAEPGYLSIALNGWAAAIDRPVTVPAGGIVVPVRVTSAGIGTTTRLLRLRVGGQVVASRPMTVAADSVRSLTVYVPALPADGCLRPVDISVGDTSTGFYARGQLGAAPGRRTTAGAAITGPGIRPRSAAGSVTGPGIAGPGVGGSGVARSGIAGVGGSGVGVSGVARSGIAGVGGSGVGVSGVAGSGIAGVGGSGIGRRAATETTAPAPAGGRGSAVRRGAAAAEPAAC